MTVVYLDRVFLLNSVVDYLLFLCAARLCGFPLHRRRLIFARCWAAFTRLRSLFPSLHFWLTRRSDWPLEACWRLPRFAVSARSSHFFCFRPPSPAPCWPSAWPLARWRDWHSGCITPMLAGKRLYWSVYCLRASPAFCRSGSTSWRGRIVADQSICRRKDTNRYRPARHG